MEEVILVTGGTGFIGSHLVEKLLQKKYKIVVPYIVIEPQSYFISQNLSQNVVLEKVDVRDRSAIFNLIKKFSVEYIIHLAAQTLVTKALEKPFDTLETNIMGTVSILEAARLNKSVKGVIIASSDKAYGKTKKTYTEQSRLAGNHPYEVSKSSADLISQTYFKTYKTPVVVTRFGNVYGEGDLHFDRIIPGICKSLVKNEKLQLRSDGTFVRDYVYVKDVINGYLFLLENLPNTIGKAYNFSSNDSLSVINLIHKCENILDKKISYSIINNQKNEIPFQHLDSSKVKKLGWIPQYTLENSIGKTFQWYSENL